MSGLEKRATYCEAADPSGTGHQSRAQSGPPVKKDTSQRSGCAVMELNLEKSQSNKNVKTKWRSCTGISLSGLGKGLKIRQTVGGAGLCQDSYLPDSCRKELSHLSRRMLSSCHLVNLPTQASKPSWAQLAEKADHSIRED